MTENVMIPGDTVYIDFHDSEIRNRSAKMCVHHGAKMAVKIMASDIDLMRFGSGSNLERLLKTIPGCVSDRDIHGLIAKKRQKLLQAYERLAGCDRMRAP